MSGLPEGGVSLDDLSALTMPPTRSQVHSRRHHVIRPASVRNIQALASTRREGIQKILFAIRALNSEEGVKSDRILRYMKRDALFSDMRAKDAERWVREFLRRGVDMGVLDVRFQGSKKIFKPGPKADQFEEAVRRNGSMLPFAKDSLTQIPLHLRKSEYVIVEDLYGQGEGTSEENAILATLAQRRLLRKGKRYVFVKKTKETFSSNQCPQELAPEEVSHGKTRFLRLFLAIFLCVVLPMALVVTIPPHFASYVSGKTSVEVPDPTSPVNPS